MDFDLSEAKCAASLKVIKELMKKFPKGEADDFSAS